MSSSDTHVKRLCAAVVTIASPLAPKDVRREWIAEWNAEICSAIDPKSGRNRRFAAVRLAARCLGAFPHAAWLRWDRWRFEMLLQDIRYAVRTLIHRPGFAVLAILTLAIGIGGNVAIFSAVRAVLLRPLPFPEPHRLVHVFSVFSTAGREMNGTVSPPDFVDWRRENRSFSEAAAIDASAYALTGEGPAEQVTGARVTGGFFKVFGVRPLYGRVLDDADDANGADAAVLGYGLWLRRFAADPAVVGRRIRLDAQEHYIVGVMPREFSYPLQSEIWLPLRFTERDLTTQRGAHYLNVVARLKPDVSIEGARRDMSALGEQLARAYPDTNRDSGISVQELRQALVGDVRPSLLMILGAVGFVLLIVCVNLANLGLTRALGRSREAAIRSALGAGRIRLVRGVLIENLLLALAGGVAGLLMALWVTQSISTMVPIGVPLLDETRVDGAVVLFALTLSVGVALLFGSLPAWHVAASGALASHMRQEGGSSTGSARRMRIRAVLIVGETALAVVLLVGAGLLLRSFMRLSSVDLGIETEGVQTFSVSLPDAAYDTPAKRAAFLDTLIARTSSLPSVRSAGAVFGLPLTQFGYVISMSSLDGRRLENQEQMERSLQVRVVTPDYFKTMGIPLIEGRTFGAADRLGSPPLVVINETAARRLWNDGRAVGRQFVLGTRLGQGGANAGGMVVGVVGDVRDAGPAAAVRPTAYLAHGQFPMAFMTVTLQSGRSPVSAEQIRMLVRELDPNLPVFRIRTMTEISREAVAQPQLLLMLISVFATMAVILAGLGIYGVLTHSVAQRTREIGIRVAVGAHRGQVIRLVVGHALGLAFLGLGIGLAAALGVSRLLGSLLFQVTPSDGPTYAFVAFTLFGVALLASAVPALRASRIDPLRALRGD